jgi:hypothetical protein
VSERRQTGDHPPEGDRRDASPPPWFAGGLSFECTCCGNCCTGGEGAVWFDDDEGRAMA